MEPPLCENCEEKMRLVEQLEYDTSKLDLGCLYEKGLFQCPNCKRIEVKEENS